MGRDDGDAEKNGEKEDGKESEEGNIMKSKMID